MGAGSIGAVAAQIVRLAQPPQGAEGTNPESQEARHG
jgi:hypothetical protein